MAKQNNILQDPVSIIDPLQAEIDAKALVLAQQIVAQQQQQNQMAANGRVFTKFDYGSDVVENQKSYVTTGLFSSNAPTMSVMYTSSFQTTTSKQYYYEVWNGTTSTSEPQFSIAYGNRVGSGSSAAGTLNDSPSKAIYSQYKQLLLNPNDNIFNFYQEASDSIYVVNFNRARMRDKLDAGNWELSLTNLSGSFFANNVHTGSNVIAAKTQFVTLIDDSGDTQQTNVVQGGRVFNIISGSIENGVYTSGGNQVYYGLAYPDMGILVLNANMLDVSMSFNSVTGSNIAGDNAWKLYTSISGAMSVSSTLYPLQARSEESVSSTQYFVRIKNGEYNFSNNPSFTTGSVGELRQPTFIGDPKTYITTIGLYNDRQELLAVAKLSKPIQKSFSKEALIHVKLDW